MYVVIFRAKLREIDAEYLQLALRLRDLALTRFGCIEFQSMTAGDDELALSWWPDLPSIQRWKAHAEHLTAQQLGRQHWYASYQVQIAEVRREYQV
jgi:heme-degrading monooxygenase HmoA